MKRLSYYLLPVFLLSILFYLPSCTSDKSADGVDKEEGPFVVTARLRGEPDRLNPVQTYTAQTIQVCHKLFPSLLQPDPFTLELVPMLAKEKPTLEALQEGEYDGDATHKYTFEILDEAVWDNGQPVLASDYLFTLKSIFNPYSAYAVGYKGALHFIKDMKVDDDNPKKFTVYIKGTFRSAEGSGLFILPEHVYDSLGLMKDIALKDLTDPAKGEELAENEQLKDFGEAFSSVKFHREVVESCGPYKLASWTPEQELILEKKENWWGDALADKYPMLTANPDKLVYKIMPDDAATIAALKGGELDVAAKLSPTGFLDFKNSTLAEDFNFYNPDIPLVMYMGLNTKKPKLADKRVRRAIAHLTDVDKIMQVIQQGFATPAISTVDKGASYFNKNLERILLDVDKAKTLLEEAGWKDSNGDGVVDKMIDGKREELVVQILNTGSATSKPLISIISEEAIKAGVKVESRLVDGRSIFNEAMAKRDFDAWVSGFSYDTDDYDPYSYWHTSADTPRGRNRFGFGNAATDKIIEEIRSTEDSDRRADLYMQFQEIVYDEQPCVFLYYTRDRIVTTKRLKDIQPSYRSPNYFENYFER